MEYNSTIDVTNLFRLPWTSADNAMTWLEPTRHCNMQCDACFHKNDPGSAKSFDQIKHELDVMMKLRKCDAMLIAGGEPLTHPEIIKITGLVRSYKCKPIIITNGLGLDMKFMKELKKAGAFGFTFHIDSHQSRAEWKGKSEEDLNILRQHYADMCYDAGLSCAYNVTVFPDTLNQMHKIVRWAIKNVDKVNILTLIAVRMMHQNDPWIYTAGTRKVNINDTPYVSCEQYRNIMASELYEEIKKVLPEYKFNSFLGGTVLADSTKWVLGTHIANKKESFGCTGAGTMELLQNGHHFITGKYLAYTKPSLNKNGRAIFLSGIIDKEIRKAGRKYLLSLLKNPLNIFSSVYAQSISVVQPIDILPEGEADTCGGCPNKTFWKERLVSACRLEEYMTYGTHISMLPKED
jgi:pyruvate-formate lyase-activating enzyme